MGLFRSSFPCFVFIRTYCLRPCGECNWTITGKSSGLSSSIFMIVSTILDAGLLRRQDCTSQNNYKCGLRKSW